MHPKPKVVISKCLGFDKCRYDGQIIMDKFIDNLKSHVDFIPVCPEFEIGLGIPRPPIRIAEVKDKITLYQPETGKILTKMMTDFSYRFLSSQSGVDGFILKNRSPSCGTGDVKIYKGFDKGVGTRRGNGFFGGAILERFPEAPVEDEGRLKNFDIRDHFLIKLYTLTRFRLAKTSGEMKELVDFHTRHKLLLLAYNQTRYRECGQIVANHDNKKVSTVFKDYENALQLALSRRPKYTSVINTLFHALGGISENISKKEKAFFLNTIEEYRDERIPLVAVTHILKSYAIRFNNEYLLDQVMLEPYPKELIRVSDSGKGKR
ncbi:MAG: DUF523 and DUF1722 domain-containing protein [Desulfobacterales bacterium]|nr:DUF523 and DUF1722 domain-containing protein [Desulfobacterales bacterium]